MDVTVTIVNWNRSDMLARCLQSVLGSECSLTFEVIVVDNASTDDSVEMVRERFPSVRLIENTENCGFGRAHNQAIAEARGEYILILNNDAAVSPDTIAALVKFMEGHPKAAICTCPARAGVGSPLLTAGGRKYFPSVVRSIGYNLLASAIPPAGWPGKRQILSWLQIISGNCAPSSEQEVSWSSGALLLARLAFLKRIGGFDERFFMYFEETDMCLQARKEGWSIWHTPVTSYLHEGGQSAALRTDRERIWSAAGFSYFRKNHGPLQAVLWLCQDYVIRQGIFRLRWNLRSILRRRFQFRSIQE